MDDDEDRVAAPRVNDQIDANLKRVYREIVGDEVPDRFRQLLDQLRNEGSVEPSGPSGDQPHSQEGAMAAGEDARKASGGHP